MGGRLAREVRRGDVRWYRFARPDKKRPVVVLTRSSALEFLSDVTVAPVTTTVRDIPTEVRLTRSDGMPRECAINLDIQTVPRSLLGPLIARVPDKALEQVREAVLFALGH